MSCGRDALLHFSTAVRCKSIYLSIYLSLSLSIYIYMCGVCVSNERAELKPKIIVDGGGGDLGGIEQG